MFSVKKQPPEEEIKTNFNVPLTIGSRFQVDYRQMSPLVSRSYDLCEAV